MVENQWNSRNMIFTLYPHDFWPKRKNDHFDPMCVDTNIPVLLVTSFVVQGHVKNTNKKR